MKVSEIDLKQYTYKRITVISAVGPSHFPAGSDDIVMRIYGEEELDAEDPVVQDETGDWLTITLAKPIVPTEEESKNDAH